MIVKSNTFLAESFAGFNQIEAIFEASTLSKTGMPTEMIRAIHTKAEHWAEKYPRMAHTYRGGVAIPMPYKYFIPAHNIEIPEPVIATGKKTNVDPYSGREIRSFYTDFHWFIESLPLGINRALICNPKLDFYMYIYHKSKSKGAPGLQYAILWWDKDQKKAVDFGYSELTTRAVDKSEIRAVHDTKGGNRSDKIQEFIRTVTRDGKDYAPSPAKPLYMYKLDPDTQAKEAPRQVKAARAKTAGVTSSDVITLFSSKFANVLPKLKSEAKNRLISKIADSIPRDNTPDAQTKRLADSLEMNPRQVSGFLFEKLRDFREELFEEGRGRLKEGASAYARTSGFDLEAENSAINARFSAPYYMRYNVSTKKYSPDEETVAAPTDYREAQPEKYQRDLPIPGDYASIPSIIKKHTLDGFLNKFAWYLLSGKITGADVSIAAILGVIVPETPGKGGEVDDENWLF